MLSRGSERSNTKSRVMITVFAVSFFSFLRNENVTYSGYMKAGVGDVADTSQYAQRCGFTPFILSPTPPASPVELDLFQVLEWMIKGQATLGGVCLVRELQVRQWRQKK